MPKYKIELKISKINKDIPPSIVKHETIEVTERTMFKLLGLWDFMKASR